MSVALTPRIPSPRAPSDPEPRHSRAVAYQRVLHQTVRREFRLLAELASWAPADDATRTAVLTGHADLMARVLLQHHTVERDLLWPALARNIPSHAQGPARGAVAAWTGRSALLDHLLRDLSTVARQWAVAQTVAARNTLVGTCARLASSVDAHLSAEERELHPLLTRYLSDAEWAEVSRAAATTLSGREQLLVLGLALEDASAIDRARVMAGLAPAMRTAWRVVGRRNYRAFVVRLRGAPPAM